jgi:UDP-N-acetylglucosamine 2-epimerase
LIFLFALTFVLLWNQTRNDLYHEATSDIYSNESVNKEVGGVKSTLLLAYRKKYVARLDKGGKKEAGCAQYDFLVNGESAVKFVQVKLHANSSGKMIWKIAGVAFWDEAESSCYI